MIEQGITTLIVSDAGMNAVIGSGCLYPVQLPENPTYPCLSYQVVSSFSDYSTDGSAEITKRIQFDGWGNAYADCKAIQAALHQLLDAFKGTLSEGTVVLGTFRGVEIDFFEQYSRVYRTMTEYVFHYVE